MPLARKIGASDQRAHAVGFQALNLNGGMGRASVGLAVQTDDGEANSVGYGGTDQAIGTGWPAGGPDSATRAE